MHYTRDAFAYSNLKTLVFEQFHLNALPIFILANVLLSLFMEEFLQ